MRVRGGGCWRWVGRALFPAPWCRLALYTPSTRAVRRTQRQPCCRAPRFSYFAEAVDREFFSPPPLLPRTNSLNLRLRGLGRGGVACGSAPVFSQSCELEFMLLTRCAGIAFATNVVTKLENNFARFRSPGGTPSARMPQCVQSPGRAWEEETPRALRPQDV